MSTKTLRIFSLIMGIIVVIFGIIMLFTPMETYAMIAMLVPVIVLFHGISCLASYLGSATEQATSGWLLADGILSTIVGIWLMFSFNIMAVVLPLIFGFWVLFAGVLRIIGAITSRHLIDRWIWLLLLGAIGVITGIFLINHLAISQVIITYLTVWCFIFMGIMGITQFFALKNVKIDVEKMIPEEPDPDMDIETD